MAGQKIIYAATEDWYFLDHWLPVATMAQAMGLEVAVACRTGERGPEAANALEAAGIRIIPWRLRRESLNPFHEQETVRELAAIYRRERPDIVHHIAIKPILYGAIASTFAEVPRVISTFVGMGFLFTQNTLKANLLRPPVSLLLRIFLNRPEMQVVTQNSDDRIHLTNAGIHGGRDMAVILGVGVDMAAFGETAEPQGPVTFTYLGRMLGDKGVGEFIAALRALKGRGLDINGVLVGLPDAANPTSFSETDINGWVREGLVDWQGYRDDIAAVWAEASVAVLPSYREGLPTSLIEAAAAGRALIATDVPGCREVVKDGESGLLVPARDADALGRAMERLALDGALRQRLAAAAKDRVRNHFAVEVVVGQNRKLYEAMLA